MDQELVQASGNGDYDRVVDLLRFGADIHPPGEYGQLDDALYAVVEWG